MSEPKHTPTPWRVHAHHKPITDEWSYSVQTDEEYGEVLASTDTSPNGPRETRLANARVMAAGPELLDALEWALDYVDESISRDLSDGAVGMGEDMDKRDRAKALIAKARGLIQ